MHAVKKINYDFRIKLYKKPDTPTIQPMQVFQMNCMKRCKAKNNWIQIPNNCNLTFLLRKKATYSISVHYSISTGKMERESELLLSSSKNNIVVLSEFY